MKYIKKAAFIVLALLLLCGCAEGARQDEKAVETAFWEEGGNTALTCCGSFYADKHGILFYFSGIINKA